MAEPSQKSEGVKIALIGAVATLAAAVVAGVFGLLQARPAEPAPTVGVAPSPQPTNLATASATVAPATGLMFASKIAPDGEALDPGNSFPTGVTDLYVVFRADAMPPGLAPFAQQAKANAHYAYFKSTGSPALNSFGWRWLKDGQQLNEFESDSTNAPFWLQRYDYNGQGVFGEWGPGTYTVVILLNGTPALSGDLTITPP